MKILRIFVLWGLVLSLYQCAGAWESDELLHIETAKTYEDYLAACEAPSATAMIETPATAYAFFEGELPVEWTVEGLSGLYTAEGSCVSWQVTVEEEGLYSLYLHYYLPEGKGKEVRRTLRLDGEIPYDAAIGIKFRRVYADAQETLEHDAQGNELRPQQKEIFRWSWSALEDSRGYVARPLQLYLSAGDHLITLEAESEPMVISQLVLKAMDTVPAYTDAAAAYEAAGYGPGAATIHVEAEDATAKSSPMLYARADRSGPAVEPHDPRQTRINTIGGSSWSQTGQWLEWTVDVQQEGLYSLTFNVRQDFVRGTKVLRQLTIDGAVPFLEAEQIGFAYQMGWKHVTFADESSAPYLVYLTAGQHTLRLTNVLGDAAEAVRQVEQAVNNLNTIYRQVVMITGTEPDGYRDYQLGAKLPLLRDELLVERNRLQQVLDAFEAENGTLGEREAPIQTMIYQLDKLHQDVERLVSSLGDFRSAIGSLGTWLTTAMENPLQLDSFDLIPAGQPIDLKEPSAWESLVYAVQNYLASFTIDYNSLSSAEGADTIITIWVATGRDQANIIKTMVDNLFTETTGIGVEIAMVDVNSLLPAVLAGQGPDVAMLIDGSLPMNYAMRGAVADLTQFADFEAVTERFHSEAMVPFTYRDACYALPETLSFPMMFYRKDILSEIGMSVPQTWDEVKAAISVLAKNNMFFGMGSLSATGSSGMNVITPYAMLLYQQGGRFYTEDGLTCALSEKEGIEAFKEFVKYYSDYTLERDYDFANLFRSGVMPIGLGDMSMFNTLQVFAPELDGLWGFACVPGTVDENGQINNAVPCGGMASVIMEGSDDKEASWEFLKWWTSTETQVLYAQELETLLGAAARYPTANQAAFERLAWNTKDLAQILKQYQSIRSVPQVPGGYYTSRCLANAFYDVLVGNNIGPREALIDQVAIIDEEIRVKRREFGLD